MKPSNNLQVVVLMGPPGAGKGTQAGLLSEKLNLFYFETSKALEQKFSHASGDEYVEVEGEKYFLSNERKRWATGMLNSPPFVTEIVKEKIQEIFNEGNSLVLAGSPRTLYEGERVMPLLEKLYKKEAIHIVSIELTEDQTIARNSHRRICQLMRHPILYVPETAHLTICPLDGSTLQKREGLDDPETIKVRLKEYRERTLPLFAYFEQQGFSVKKINGNESVSQVFSDITKALEVL